ncbi:uncharacterized protein LOC129218333 isoform X1 [Uloborus diversus]|uniref:uncharacterized protein LOC129218333 isoform X1 n=1 Tax=Uloborus diversus TaxID=327109 RepID=UPI00240A7682|nr:uncharacterized protein LOC129218333 isoform X1 [Uloborus diversus]
MPQNSTTDENHPVSRWRNFHFSGKVIICSVLFGLGLVLIGGLVFAIGINDNEDEKLKENTDEIPTKAPSSIVGPIIMGIGGFIATVGVIMCLFETQVCRKRKGDGSPLINEQRRESHEKNTDPKAVASTSRSRDNHRHKKSSSPRRSKGTKKSHSKKEKNSAKSPSLKSPPIIIGSSGNFLTSSESNFRTPPSSFAKDSIAFNSNSHDAGIQTGTSLMKSFTSSGPSWNVSTEFRTPEASFKETSSLETSVQTDDLETSSSTLDNPPVDSFLKINNGFLTPVFPPENTAAVIKKEIVEQNLENSPLVQSSFDQNISIFIQKKQENKSDIVSDVDGVAAASFMHDSTKGETNTVDASIEHSQIELLKEELTDSSAHVVLQNNEIDDKIGVEKDNVGILLNPKTNESEDLSSIPVASICKKYECHENEENRNKNKSEPSEQSNISHTDNLAKTTEKIQHENELGVTRNEEHIDKLTSCENVIESADTMERNINDLDINDTSRPETICNFLHDTELKTTRSLNSEQAELVAASPSNGSPKSNELNEDVGYPTEKKIDPNKVTDNSHLNFS